MNRPDLASTFTKIALWRQTQFRRIVYVDADIVALRAPDELFKHESRFAAVTDIGWPDCFNTGVMVFSPNMGDYYALLALAQRGISFDGADQGLLNMHFRSWDRLSFTYNCTPSGNYQYVPAYRHFQSSINMLHYIGPDKPWTMGRGGNGSTEVYEELLGRWWAVYDRHYRAPVGMARCQGNCFAERAQTTAYISGQSMSTSRVVQQHVKGEASTADYGYSSAAPAIPSMLQIQEPEASASTEQPLLDKQDPAEGIIQGDLLPVRTAEQRRFSAPQVQWDPAR